MHDQSYLAEKGAYPSRPKRRLFSAYLSVRNARVAALPEMLGENGRGTTARVRRVSMKRAKRATAIYDRAYCYAFFVLERDHLGNVVLAVTSWPLVSHDILKRTVI